MYMRWKTVLPCSPFAKKHKMEALVSIIIPCYNGEKFIGETIRSVMKQTYRHWNLIVVDDGSIDNSKKVVEGFADDKRIQYTYQQNAGVSSARNKGITMAEGEFVCFLDADDIWTESNLEKKLSMLQQNPDIGWVFSDMYMADATLKTSSLAPVGTDRNILNNLLLWESEVVPGPCSNLMVRSKCLKEKKISFDTKLSTAADLDFCMQLASNYKGKRIAEPLFYYRVLNNSMSKSVAAMERDQLWIYKKAVQNKLFKSFWFKQKCFSNNFLILAGSYWVNANNKKRGIYYIFRAIIAYPPSLLKLAKKLVR
jgi:glycosyltransferase involved in cell wall biosynthesis